MLPLCVPSLLLRWKERGPGEGVSGASDDDDDDDDDNSNNNKHYNIRGLELNKFD